MASAASSQPCHPRCDSRSGCDQGAEDQQRGELRQLGQQVTERLELLGDRVIERGEHRTGGEGRQIRVGVREVTAGVHHDGDRHRSQRLKSGLGGQDSGAPRQRHRRRDAGAQQQAQEQFHPYGGHVGLLVLGGGEEDQHEGKRQAVVQPGLHVEEPSQAKGDVGSPHQGRGEHRVGRRQDRSDEQRRGPVQSDQKVGGNGDADHRQRHSEAERAAGKRPILLERREIRALAVGEQNREQGDVGE